MTMIKKLKFITASYKTNGWITMLKYFEIVIKPSYQTHGWLTLLKYSNCY